MKKFIEFMYAIVTGLIVVAVVVGALYLFRTINEVATPMTLHSPKPGISCVSMVTDQDVAVSCWKD